MGASGEIDIMETCNTTIILAVQFITAEAGLIMCIQAQVIRRRSGFFSAFHVYTLEWEPP